MLNTLLVMHIFFAISSFLFCGVSLGGAILNKGNYKILFNLNLVQAVITTFSGAVLFVAQSVAKSKLEFCVRLGIYLSIIVVTEWTLYTRILRERVFVEQA